MFKHKFQITKEQIAIAGLVEFACLFGVHMFDTYLGGLFTVIFSVIPIGTLIVSGLAELIERSNISKSYFFLLIVLSLVPIAASLAYKLII